MTIKELLLNYLIVQITNMKLIILIGAKVPVKKVNHGPAMSQRLAGIL